MTDAVHLLRVVARVCRGMEVSPDEWQMATTVLGPMMPAAPGDTGGGAADEVLREARRGLMALRLEVVPEIADDVSRRCEAAFAVLRSLAAPQSRLNTTAGGEGQGEGQPESDPNLQWDSLRRSGLRASPEGPSQQGGET